VVTDDIILPDIFTTMGRIKVKWDDQRKSLPASIDCLVLEEVWNSPLFKALQEK